MEINFVQGDMFKYKDGVGVVIKGNRCLLVIGEGGRLGYSVTRGYIPRDAGPVQSVNHEQRMAIMGAMEGYAISQEK